jgi:hypothetical protein
VAREENGLIPYELLRLKEKISLLQSYVIQFYLPKEAEQAVVAAFNELLSAVDRIANLLVAECKNDTP